MPSVAVKLDVSTAKTEENGRTSTIRTMRSVKVKTQSIWTSFVRFAHLFIWKLAKIGVFKNNKLKLIAVWMETRLCSADASGIAVRIGL